MRISSLCGALALAGCSGGGGDPPPDPASLIDCALDGADSFARECAVERSLQTGTLFLTIRHPDGSFRRFEVRQDGSGVSAADGAETAKVAMAQDGIEVSVGSDRYRLPARIESDDTP